ncbi:MAG: penicillin-binding transpeptidase domain-containing protein [Enterococcus sp.]
MRFRKIRKYFRNKNLAPMNNRKNVGKILFLLSIGLFFLFSGRLTYIVVKGEVAGTSLKEKTEALYSGTAPVSAKRGTIYDRNGVVIAEDATSYSVYAILSDTYVSGDDKLYAQEKDFETIAEILHDVLKINEKSALQTLKDGAKNNQYQVEFNQSGGKDITLEKKEQVEAEMEKADIKGLYFNEKAARIYPNGIFASHFIGIAESEDESANLEGKFGLEAAYDDLLSGSDGEVTYQKDNYGNPLPGTVAEEKEAVDGQDIYTTLDSRLQSYLETLMDASYEEYNPENMTAMLMDAKTGELVAMSQRPTFNPETQEELSDPDFEWRNLLVEDRYEPGSTMKILTVASAIDQGIFDEDESYQSGSIQVGDVTISDWDKGAKGVLTMRQALSWSSNVGMVMLEQQMETRWQRYLQQYGFGQSTYSGLPGENAGTLPTDNIVDKAMSSFGQAIGVTNFQMMRAFSAIANNGTMLKPQYINKIVDPNTGDQRVTEPEVVGRPITKEAATQVREYMRDVVESAEYGSAYSGEYKVDDYHIAAKTGTAQVVSDNGGYMTGESAYLYSIVEMVPAEDPEYVLYMTMKLPEEWSQKALSSIGNPLLQRAMDFKESEETASKESTTEKISVTDYRNLETTTAASEATKAGLMPIVIGTGDKIKQQSLDSGTKVLPSGKIIFKTNGDEFYMPDVTGWSKADLEKLGNLFDLEVSFSGDGYCVNQSIEPYELIDGKKIKFTLE